MIKAYKAVVKEYADASFIEKKSEFIAYVKRIEDESEAKTFIESIRAKHKDATHNVFAYILKGSEIARCSDDGEPSGTAGMPSLEVLRREGLSGVCVVITRYFGGILLGAGGLVRAYGKAAKMGIDEAGIAEFVPYVRFEVAVPYSDYDKIQKEMPKYFINCDETDFQADVKIKMNAKNENYEKFKDFILEYTSGKSKCIITGETYGPV